MFKNVGRKIQAIISLAFTVDVVVSCIAGFALGVYISEGAESPVAGILVGLLVFGIGVFISWVSLLLVYAFGKIEEECEEHSRLLKILIDKQDDQKKVCASCNAVIDSDAVFCSKCGTKC